MVTRAGDRAAARARAVEVLDLYADGLSILSISRRLEITPQQAQRRLAEALAALPAQAVTELRDGTELRLDRAAEVFAELAENATDERIRLQATQGLVGVVEKRARLLGLSQKPPPDDD